MKHKPWSKRYYEFKLKCEGRGAELLDTEAEWIEGTKKEGHFYKPNIRCLTCEDIVKTTCINNFTRKKFGCKCYKNKTKNKTAWSERYKEFKLKCEGRGSELLDTEAEWIEGTKKEGCYYKPNIRCLTCEDIVKTTCINNFTRKKFGCKCYKNKTKNKTAWSERYKEFKLKCEGRGSELLDTEAEWIEGTKKEGCYYKPNIRCLTCEDIVKTTCINNFTRKKLGCECYKNKTAWSERYKEFKLKCEGRGSELLDTEAEWIEGTKKEGCYYKPNIRCLTCEDIVKTTCINNFTRKKLGCECYKNKTVWSKRYKEFKLKCEGRGSELLDTEAEWIEGTKKEGCYYKPNIRCLTCEDIVKTTCINNFTRKKLGCECAQSHSETVLREIMEKIFYPYKFPNTRPDWLINRHTRRKLEIDCYCKPLKIGGERQGKQHEKYIPYFHRKGKKDFWKQQDRDRQKMEQCKEKGVVLIVSPSKYSYLNPDEMCDYVIDQLWISRRLLTPEAYKLCCSRCFPLIIFED